MTSLRHSCSYCCAPNRRLDLSNNQMELSTCITSAASASLEFVQVLHRHTLSEMLQTRMAAMDQICHQGARTVLPEMSNQNLQPWLQKLGLRFFMPKEIANMHSFPVSFAFPGKVKLRKQYALIGNSVSAAVVGGLLEYLLLDADQSGRLPS